MAKRAPPPIVARKSYRLMPNPWLHLWRAQTCNGWSALPNALVRGLPGPKRCTHRVRTRNSALRSTRSTLAREAVPRRTPARSARRQEIDSHHRIARFRQRSLPAQETRRGRMQQPDLRVGRMHEGAREQRDFRVDDEAISLDRAARHGGAIDSGPRRHHVCDAGMRREPDRAQFVRPAGEESRAQTLERQRETEPGERLTGLDLQPSPPLPQFRPLARARHRFARPEVDAE